MTTLGLSRQVFRSDHNFRALLSLLHITSPQHICSLRADVIYEIPWTWAGGAKPTVSNSEWGGAVVHIQGWA